MFGSRRAGLFLKYFAIIGALVAAAMAAVGAIGLYFSYQETRQSLAVLQREKALTAAVQIENFLTDIERQLGWTAMPMVETGKAAIEARRLDFIRLQRQLQAVTETSHIDGQGREQLKISRLDMNTVGSGIDFSKDPRFTEARKGKTWFGPVYFRKDTEPYMAISIPEARDRPGVTVVEVNLKFIWEVVSRIRIGTKGYAYVVDDKGFLIAHPEISLVLKKLDLSGLPQVKQAISSPAAAESPDVEDAHDIEGAPVFAAWAPVSATGWRVLVEEPRREVLAPVYAAITRTVYMFLAGLALSVVASLFLARRMVTPVRALQRGAERIGAGDLDSRIDVRTHDELEDLAGRFNEMAGQLKESYAGLERKVEERTTELREALSQQTATAQILRVISESPTDPKPVFEAIVEAAVGFGNARGANLSSFDGQLLHSEANTTPQIMRTKPFAPTRSTLSGRVILEGRTVEIIHAASDPEYDRSQYATGLVDPDTHGVGVPMLRDGKPIGVLNVWFPGRGPAARKYVQLLETFASQAVIAVENIRLFNETKEALEQQTASNEILAVISNSLASVTPVFNTILEKAVALCDAQFAVLGRYDGERYEHIAQLGASEEFASYLFRGPFVPDPGTAVERMVKERTPFQVRDLQESPMYKARLKMAVMMVEYGGGRTYLALPMLKDGQVVGGIIIYRKEVREFTPRQIEVLSSFANQAVIAIENVRLFNEIQDKGRQLEIANKHKSEFLANMSHELRTPLNAIIGFSEVMVNGMAGPMSEDQKDFAGDIRDSGKHLLTLINDILDLSKIEAGRMELDVGTFDLQTAMHNAMTLVQGRAQRSGIRLATEISPAVSEYMGDERKFKQIVINLLSNAVKFTPEGGKVTLAADRVNGAYSISVRDTGIGIAPEDQEKIFEEFKQVGSDYARKAEGTGLGLTLTRKLVELHGGHITVESEPGRGSKFTFTLPLEA